MSWNNTHIASGSKVEDLVLIGADLTNDDAPGARYPAPYPNPGATTNDQNGSVIAIRNMMTGGIDDFTFKNITTEVTPYSFMIVQLEDNLVYTDPPRGLVSSKCTAPMGPPRNCQELDGNGRITDLKFENITIKGHPPYRGRLDRNASNPNYQGPAPNNPPYTLPDTIDTVELKNVKINGKYLVTGGANGITTESYTIHLNQPSGAISSLTAFCNEPGVPGC